VLDRHLSRDPALVMVGVLHVEESGGRQNACRRTRVGECWLWAFSQVTVDQAEDDEDSNGISPRYPGGFQIQVQARSSLFTARLAHSGAKRDTT